MVGERDLARARRGAAADQAGRGDRVVRRAERPPPGDRVLDRAPARARDLRRLDRLPRAERRQDRRQPPRRHRLARPGRPADQDRVAAGRRDLERPAQRRLAAQVGEIRRARAVGAERARTGCGAPRLAVACRARAAARGARSGPPCRPRPAPPRAPQAAGTAICPHSRPPRGLGHRHRPRDGAESRRRARARPPGRCRRAPRRELAGGGEHGRRDRQVEARPRLAQVGRRQVRRDPLLRELEAGVDQRRAHPLARLAHRRVGQADERERRAARCGRRPRPGPRGPRRRAG